MDAPTLPPPFRWPVRVYWEDTDAGGVVFYANYLRFFERARTEWLRQAGVQQQALREQTGGMFVVSDVQVRYLRPARLDDLLTVTAQRQSVGRAAITLHQQALAEDGRLLCEATVRIGWVDGHTLRPARLPESLLERLP